MNTIFNFFENSVIYPYISNVWEAFLIDTSNQEAIAFVENTTYIILPISSDFLYNFRSFGSLHYKTLLFLI